MELRCVFGFVFLVLCSSRMYETKVDKQIKLAYLSKADDWRTCLQIDFATVSPAKKPLDLGGFIHVSEIKSHGRNCDTFHLSMIVDELLIVMPNRQSSKCFHFSDCRAYVIIKNQNMIIGNSKCFDVLSGQYWHDQQVDTVDEFQIKNLKPRGTICDYTALDKLVQPKALTGAVSDIFSPVEDIVNDAVAKVEDFGNQFTTTITNQLNVVQDAVTEQINTISIKIQQQTDVVTGVVTKSFNAVGVQIQKVEDAIQKDVSKAEKYFHIFLHILEFFGLCVLIKFVYGLYKRANGVFTTVSWIWSRIVPGNHHNAQNQNPNHHPGHPQNPNHHPGHPLNPNHHPGHQHIPIA